MAAAAALGWLSWYLKGNDFWTWSSALFGVLLGVGIWDRVKDWMGGAEVRRREVVLVACCIATWVVWFRPGCLFPAVPIRDGSGIDVSVLASGSITYTAAATDGAGNTAIASRAALES
jgi:hypothetical protein